MENGQPVYFVEQVKAFLNKGTSEDACPSWSVMIRVYANVADLSTALTRGGVLNAASDMAHFVTGFNRSMTLVDFLDVG